MSLFQKVCESMHEEKQKHKLVTIQKKQTMQLRPR